jgi:hypothetical protein
MHFLFSYDKIWASKVYYGVLYIFIFVEVLFQVFSIDKKSRLIWVIKASFKLEDHLSDILKNKKSNALALKTK